MQEILVLGQREVRQLLPMDECIRLVAEALVALAEGRGQNPLRTAMMLEDRSGLLGTMPSALDEPAALGIKVIAVYPGNHGTAYDAHQGAVLVFERDHGCLVAVVDASEITAIRTAAASGLATRELARPDARSVGILGSGIQARTHLEAMLAVRPIERAWVWSATPAHAEAFAAREGERHGIPVLPTAGARDAVEGADIVCTTTSASEPVLLGEWLAPGTHVNAAGACTPMTRELDTAAVVGSRVFVDRIESALAEAGEFLIPRSQGALDDDAICGEIGDLLRAKIAGRRDTDEVTLFKSLGIGVEDLITARFVYDAARRVGLGTTVEFTGPPPGR